MTRKTAKSPSKTDETAAEVASSIAVEVLSELRKEIRGVIDGSAKSRRGDKHMRIAQLGLKAAVVAAEQRKAEKGELDAIRKLSPEVVMTWIRQQTAEYRARLVREVSAIDSKERRSVLG